jgi:hypothetical protein
MDVRQPPVASNASCGQYSRLDSFRGPRIVNAAASAEIATERLKL